jgi:uncharacterized protein (DUF2141 family)
MTKWIYITLTLFALGGVWGTGSTILLAQDNGTLTVTITGFPSSKGTAMVALYNSAESYEGTEGEDLSNQKVKIEGQKAQVIFVNLPYGWYGISFYHDENNNGKMDKNPMGIPKEAYGFSNNAKGRFGKPGFQDIKFQLDSPEKEITINIK